MSTNINYQDLLDEINNLTVIDAHDHIIPEEDSIDKNFFYFFPHYVSYDIVSAGMDFNSMVRLVNSKDYNDEEIEIFFKYWDKTKNTTYTKSLLRGIKEIFGFDDININNYKELEKAFNETKVN
ncbi:MAG: hypothetical protein ACYDIA_12770 [Candidatus Humimicrobiaceae bacterium]